MTAGRAMLVLAVGGTAVLRSKVTAIDSTPSSPRARSTVAAGWRAVRAVASNRLMALFFILGIIPLAGLAYSSIQLASNAVGGAVQAHAQSGAAGGALILNQTLSSMVRQQQELAAEPRIGTAIRTGDSASASSVLAQLAPYALDTDVAWVAIFDRQQNLIGTWSNGMAVDPPPASWLSSITTTDQAQVSNAFRPGYFAVGSPVGSPSAVLGSLVSAYRDHAIQSLVDSYDGITKVNLAVRDGQGHTIAGPASFPDGATTGSAVLSSTSWTVIGEVPPDLALFGLDRLRLIVIVSAALLAVVLMVGMIAFSQALISEQEGRLLSRTDQLTGLPNRRVWDEELPREAARAKRSGLPLCVGLIDLDHFKVFNDTFGHPAGDELLATTGKAWASEVRSTDLLARYGGEEFAVLLPNCTLDEAISVIERLRARIPANQTCSAGVSQWNPTEPIQDAVCRADAALYAAKRRSRNCTVPAA